MMMTDEKNDDDRDDDDGNKTFLKRSFPSQEFKLPMCVSDWSVRVLFPRYSPSYWENITIAQLVTYFDFHIF